MRTSVFCTGFFIVGDGGKSGYFDRFGVEEGKVVKKLPSSCLSSVAAQNAETSTAFLGSRFNFSFRSALRGTGHGL